MNDLERILGEEKGGLHYLGVMSKTCIGFDNEGCLYMFDIEDGHLALKFNRKTKKIEYECEHMKLGRNILDSLSKAWSG